MSEPTNRKGENGDRVDARVAESQVDDDAVANELSDAAFDAYLQRGSTVSQSYRAIEHEHPPAQLDAIILARAQAELRTNTSQKYRHWKKWTVPVALAASTVMAVSIVLESGMQHEVRSVASQEVFQRESPKLTSEPANDVTSSAVEQGPSSTMVQGTQSDAALAPVAPSAPPREAVEEKEQLYAFQAPRPAPSPSVSSANQETRAAPIAMEAAEQEVQLQKATAARAMSAARAQSAERSESTLSAAAPQDEALTEGDSAAHLDSRAVATQIQIQASRRDPAAWLGAIRELRAAGKDEEADREWRAFEAAYANFEVAVDDVARPVNERN